MKAAFEQHPGRILHVDVFHQVSNSATLLSSLQEAGTRACLLRADRVASTFVLLSAAQRALHGEAHGKMKTRSLETEVLFNLSNSNSISHAFRTWGVADDTNSIVVCMWEPTDKDVASIRSIVKGKRPGETKGNDGESTFNQEAAVIAAEIDTMTDTKREGLIKLYKLKPKELELMSAPECIANILSVKPFKSR